MDKQLLVYKSSAGSGKTTRLVIEYLNLVIPHPGKFRHILAITFTNKAAEEMKSRIINVLKSLSTAGIGPSKVFVEQLLNEGFNEKTIRDNAGIVLKRILHDYSNFAVSTIDSLMHRIIRSFAFDLKLSQRFEVVLDQEELIQKAVDILLDSLEPKHRLTHFLIDFVKSRTDESHSWHIDRALYDFAKVLQTDEAIDYIPVLKRFSLGDYMEAEKNINKFIFSFENYVDQKANKAMELIGDIPSEAFPHNTTGVYGFFRKIVQKKYREKEGMEVFRANSHANKFFQQDSLTSKKATPDQKTQIQDIAPQLLQIYEEISLFANKKGEQYFFFRLLLRNIHGIAVLKEIEQHLSTLKEEKDLVHISEFNRRIANQIQSNASVPFIYERIGEKYKHCFVDEFQDTSVLQWHNLLPLVANGLANNDMNMLVGDAKQSIYRWRGGEVEQFAYLPKLFDKRRLNDGEVLEKSLTDHFNEKVLNTNYRTSATIVDFNNRLFDYIKNKCNQKAKQIYAHHEQNAFHEAYGKVQIDFVNGKGDELEAGHLKNVEQAIKEATADGFKLGDIAVLCRTKDKGMKVARHLSGIGYPVVSSDSLLLSGSPKLHFLAALLKLLNNPSDDISLLEAMSFLYHAKSSQEKAFHDYFLDSLQAPGDRDIYTAADKYSLLLRALGLSGMRWEEYSLYDLVEHLVRHFSLHAHADPFITFFMEEVHKKAMDAETSLGDFIEWWEANKTKKSIVAPEGSDAVKVYTVHKSKGLEFPVVITPFISKSVIRLTKDNLWVVGKHDYPETKKIPVAYLPSKKALESTVYANDFLEEQEKSLLDEINVMYVAFTRAAKRLCISSDLPSPNTRSSNMAGFLSGFIAVQGMVADEETPVVFEGGKEEDKPTREEFQEAPFLKDIVSTSWRNKIVIASQADGYSSDTTEKISPKHWGNLMHSALAMTIHAEDVQHVVGKLLAAGILTEPQKDMLRKNLEKIVAHQELKHLFDNRKKVLTEHAILMRSGEELRPDRLVFDGKQVSVVEYKTGQEHDSHRKQLFNYEEAMREMGYTIAEKYLVYLNEEVEVRVLK